MLDMVEKDPMAPPVPREGASSSESKEEELIGLPAPDELPTSEHEEAAYSGELVLMQRRLPPVLLIKSTLPYLFVTDLYIVTFCLLSMWLDEYLSWVLRYQSTQVLSLSIIIKIKESHMFTCMVLYCIGKGTQKITVLAQGACTLAVLESATWAQNTRN